jgi:phage baseplate assembly protein W
MAKINLNTLPKKQTAAPYQYKDIHLDLIPEFTVTGELYKTPEQKDFKADYDVTAIKNSIRNLLTTSPGEKILNPAYGCDLRGLLFEQVTKNIGEQIGNIIYKQITTFEPRIRIDRLDITVSPEEQQYDIELSFSVPTLNLVGISILGILNSNGYVFNNK